MKVRIPVPREHGAWAMLYGPLVVAVATIGRFEWSVLLFLVAVTAVFLAHEPLATVARSSSSRAVNAERLRQSRRWLIIYFAIAAGATAPLLVYYQRLYLIMFGALLGALLMLHIYLASKRAERKIMGEFLGVLSLTLTAPGAYYIVQGRFDKLSLLLWVLNMLYFTSAIFYVKMRVSKFAKKKESSLLTWQCTVYHAFLLVFISSLVWLGWIPGVVFLAFVPIILRAFWAMASREFRLNLKRIGFTELGYTMVFVVFLVWGLRLS